MSATFERVTPPSPGPSPAEAEAAAVQADRRAAQAKAVAEHASKIAKDARAAAGEATREAAKMREVADPRLRERTNLSVAQAKLRLLEAARAIDPVGSMRAAVRDHPFVAVGAALGAGALVGTLGGSLGSLLRLGLSVMKVAKPLALAGAQFAASHIAAKQAATEVKHENPPAGAPYPPETSAIPPR
jgi:ElaB/YqjD/DUF883 family membrane-anchored ribosome-binding protein